jgi:hypothetical protein
VAVDEGTGDSVGGEAATERPIETADLLALATGDEVAQGQAVRRIVQLWESQDRAMKRRHVFWQRNRLWLKGYPAVQAMPVSTDLSEWRLDIPYALEEMTPVMSRVDTLLERLAAHLFVDRPEPLVEPSQDTDQARDAAEFAERLLTVDGAENGTNDLRLFTSAEKRAGVPGSSFVFFRVDPFAGGWRPMEIMAHPQAQSVEDAAIDPFTGAPATPDQLMKRYVTAEGVDELGQPVPAGLTDDPRAADQQWLPRVVPKLVSPYQVRVLPETAEDIADAEAALVLMPWTLGQLRATFPDWFATLDVEDQEALIKWRPQAARWSLAWYVQEGLKQELPKGPEGEPHPDELVWTLAWYAKACPDYPWGGYVLTAGGKWVCHAQEWAAEIETPDGMNRLPLDIPIAQCKQLTDDDAGDFYGRGVVEDLGPADNLRMQIIEAWRDHLDRFLHPHTFLPLGSNVQAEQLATRGTAPIYVNPAGTPIVEPVPPFLPDGKEMLDRATMDMNDTLGLWETGMQVSGNAKSGIAKQIDLQQSNANISGIRQNAVTFIERYWRLKLQLWSAFCTIPQRVRFVGEDGAYKEREWSATDLRDVAEVRIRAGSFTQMTPDQKEQYVSMLLQQQRIDADEAERLLASNASARLGRLDNPHRMRVRRQLAAWRQGPSAEWMQQAQQYEQAQQLAQEMAQQQPQTPDQPPMPPEAFLRVAGIAPPPSPFDTLPVDEEPPVARIRHAELQRAMAGTEFASFPRPWQGMLVQAYEQARQAAGLILPREQAEQQQAQMQQQMQMQAQQQQAAEQARAAAAAEQARIKEGTKAEAQMAVEDAKARNAQLAREHEMTIETMTPAVIA